MFVHINWFNFVVLALFINMIGCNSNVIRSLSRDLKERDNEIIKEEQIIAITSENNVDEVLEPREPDMVKCVESWNYSKGQKNTDFRVLPKKNDQSQDQSSIKVFGVLPKKNDQSQDQSIKVLDYDSLNFYYEDKCLFPNTTYQSQKDSNESIKINNLQKSKFSPSIYTDVIPLKYIDDFDKLTECMTNMQELTTKTVTDDKKIMAMCIPVVDSLSFDISSCSISANVFSFNHKTFASYSNSETPDFNASWDACLFMVDAWSEGIPKGCPMKKKTYTRSIGDSKWKEYAQPQQYCFDNGLAILEQQYNKNLLQQP